MMKQLNLLPRARRANLRREVPIAAAHRFLISVLAGLIIVTAGALGTAGILAAWSASHASVAQRELDALLAEYRTIKQEVSDYDALLESVVSVSRERLTWVPLLIQLLEILPEAATIETIEINGEASQISFSGATDTRASLVDFEEQLRALPWMEELAAPSSNLLRRSNPEYSFTITVHSDVEN